MAVGPHPDGVRVELTNHAAVRWDISEFVTAISISRGRSDPADRYRPGVCSVAVLNDDARFSPWNVNGPYGAIAPNWVLAVHLGSTPVYSGYVDSVEELRRGDSPPMATITATDGMKLLATARDTPLVNPVGANELPGARINRLLNAAGWASWLRQLDQGGPALAATTIAGNILEEIFDVADSDPGWFLIDKAGSATFWASNHSQPSWTAPVATFSDWPAPGEIDCVALEAETTDDLVVTRAIVTNVEDETTQVDDTAAQAVHGRRTFVRDGLWFTDAAHGAVVGQAAVSRTGSLVRVRTVTVVAWAGLPSTDPRWAAVTNPELHDRVRVVQHAGGLRVQWDAWIDSIRLDITPHQIQARYGLSPIIGGSWSTTVVAAGNLTATLLDCTTVRAAWTLTGRAQWVDVKIEPTAQPGSGTWRRMAGGTTSTVFRRLAEDTDWTVFVRVMAADGTTSTTSTIQISTGTCVPPSVGPGGDITQPPGSQTCTQGVRKVQWILSKIDTPQLIDVLPPVQLETGFHLDDGSDIRQSFTTTLQPGVIYELCTRLVCVDNGDQLLETLTTWSCTRWREPASWTNVCLRSQGDPWQQEATAINASWWLDWCPGPISTAPKLRDPSTLALTQATALDGLTSVVDGPASIGPSLAGANDWSPANTQMALLAAAGLPPSWTAATPDQWTLRFWLRLRSWTGGPDGPISGSSWVPLVNIGNAVIISAWRVYGNLRIMVEVLIDDDGTPRWRLMGGSAAGDVAWDEWHRVTITWDKLSDEGTIKIDDTSSTLRSWTVLPVIPPPLDQLVVISAPPAGAIGQVMIGATTVALTWPFDESSPPFLSNFGQALAVTAGTVSTGQSSLRSDGSGTSIEATS